LERSGNYTEPGGQATLCDRAEQTAMSQARHGRACPGHPRFPSNGNQERGCPGAVYAKATTGLVLVSPKL